MGAEGQEEEKVDGKELFRELLRWFPSAELEDYYQNGRWDVETLEIDRELIEAHRKEAGAPEPIPLEEVVMPELPKFVGTGLGMARPGMQQMQQPWQAGQQAFPKPVLAPTQRPTPLPKPVGVTTGLKQQTLMSPSAPKALGAASRPATASTGATTTVASAELRQIALFIQRWKLPTTPTKLLLARVMPAKRKWVMTNYKGVGTLESFVQQSDSTNAWASAVNGAVAAPKPTPKPAGLASGPAATAAGATKRPLSMLTPSAGATFADPSKRARLTYGVGAAGNSSSSSQAAKAFPARQPQMMGTAARMGMGGGGPVAKPAGYGSGYGGGPAWAARPGIYGAPGAMGQGAAYYSSRPLAKPMGFGGAARPAPKPSGALGLASRPGMMQPSGGPKAYASGAARPPLAKPKMSMMTPTAKPAAKAPSSAKPGSLIRSLLKSA